jgi:futalosine hydrolase
MPLPLSDILVVAATARELAPSEGWRSLVCGVGPVEAAATTSASIAQHRPALILHVGIAGTRRGRGLVAGSLVIGGESRYSDLSTPVDFAPRNVSPDGALLAAAQRAFPDAPVLTIGTTARVGGSVDCDVEAMEGFAVLRAAQMAGVPAIEIRAISNEIEEADRSRWHFDRAFDAIVAITPALVLEFARSARDA